MNSYDLCLLFISTETVLWEKLHFTKLVCLSIHDISNADKLFPQSPITSFKLHVNKYWAPFFNTKTNCVFIITLWISKWLPKEKKKSIDKYIIHQSPIDWLCSQFLFHYVGGLALERPVPALHKKIFQNHAHYWWINLFDVWLELSPDLL